MLQVVKQYGYAKMSQLNFNYFVNYFQHNRKYMDQQIHFINTNTSIHQSQQQNANNSNSNEVLGMKYLQEYRQFYVDNGNELNNKQWYYKKCIELYDDNRLRKYKSQRTQEQMIDRNRVMMKYKEMDYDIQQFNDNYFNRNKTATKAKQKKQAQKEEKKNKKQDKKLGLIYETYKNGESDIPKHKKYERIFDVYRESMTKDDTLKSRMIKKQFDDQIHLQKLDDKGDKYFEKYGTSNDNILFVFFDGACQKSEGGIGTVIYDNYDQIVYKHSQYLGKGVTNNQMEYAALQWAMNVVLYWKQKYGYEKQKVVVIGDSQLVIRQMQGIYTIKNKILYELFIKCFQIGELMDIQYVFVKREYNEIANQCAQKAVKQQKL